MTRIPTCIGILCLLAVCLTSEARAGTIILSNGTIITMLNPYAVSNGPLTLTGLGAQGSPTAPLSVDTGQYYGYYNGGIDPQVGVWYSTYPYSICSQYGVCGGENSLYATYQFVWDPGSGYAGPSTVSASLLVSDTLASNAPSPYGDAYLVIGAFDQPFIYQQEDCFNTTDCVTGAPSNDYGAITNTTIMIQEDTLYTVQMWVDVQPEALGYWASASIDPQLSLPDGTPGQIDYSDGIGNVPEPTSLSLLGTGLAFLLGRRARRPR